MCIKTRAVSWPLLLPSLRSLCEKTNLPLLRDPSFPQEQGMYPPTCQTRPDLQNTIGLGLLRVR